MKNEFYIILLFVTFVTLTHTKAEASVYVAKNFKHVFPVPYSPRILRILPLQRCFTNNFIIKCQSKTPKPYEYVSHNFNGVRDESKTNYIKSSPMQEIIQINTGRRTLEEITSPIKNVQLTEILKSSLDAADVNVENITEKTKNDKKLIKVVNLEKDALEKAASINENDVNATNAQELKTSYNTQENKGKESSVKFRNEDILSPRATTKNQTNLDAQNYFQNSLNSALNQFERELYLLSKEQLVLHANEMNRSRKALIYIDRNRVNKVHAQAKANFMKFSSLTPVSKGDSGISFLQSGLFLAMSLTALSTEVDFVTKNEIDQNIAFNVSDLDKPELIRQVMSSLPKSSEDLKFRWSSRLVLRSGRQLSQDFITGTAQALQLKIDHFEDAQTPQAMVEVLNRMIEEDSGGAIHDTFEEEDLSENGEAVLITTLYFRARYRTAPTLLNGTWLFRDSGNAPSRTIKMIRVNDIMKYVDLPEWNAEAIEIPYQTAGLSLLMLVPRGSSLKRLVEHVTVANLTSITERMQSIRAEASLPLYTLRMTLLLPNKLQAMGLSRIVNVSEAEDGSLRISQAVQRIMFWAEAGRNAFKDDGLQWDEAPEMFFFIDRPYMFYVRWQDLNIISGNFVL